MIYGFRKQDGTEVEVVAPMVSPPPDRVVLDDTDNRGWRPATDLDPSCAVLERIYEAPIAIVKAGGGVQWKGQKVPISNTLPDDDRPHEVVTRFGRKVRLQADGTYSTLSGRRIVDTREAREKHAAACGRIPT